MIQKKENKQISFYKFYLDFLQLEIPNLLQIFTLISLLSIMSKQLYVRVFFIVLINFLIQLYASEKIMEYLKQEMLNPLSRLYITKVNFTKQSLHWKKEMTISSIVTGIVFAILLTIISYLIRPF